jgi:hypothetical protein
MSSTIASSMITSGTLAAVTATARGNPCPSQTRWSLDPGLPRSTGFAPTWSPAFGAHAHGVHAGARPAELALLAEPVKDVEVELVEHPSPGPLVQPPPCGRGASRSQARGRAAAARGWRCGPCRRSRQSSCGRGWPAAGHRRAGGVGMAETARPSPTAGLARVRQRGSPWAGACHTRPKGAKRRLRWPRRDKVHACWNREVVQRREGLWLHRP